MLPSFNDYAVTHYQMPTTFPRPPRSKKEKKREGRITCIICAFCLASFFLLGCVVEALQPKPFDEEFPTPKVPADYSATQ